MRVVFMGSPQFAVPSLDALLSRHEVALVVTQPDKRAGRGKRMAAPAVKVAAEAAGIDVLQPSSARTGELRAAMAATGAELAVVVAYGKILPPDVLDVLPGGCLNVHASVLPAYRGAAPVQWSIIRGETQTGVSIMQLDEGMDTGPVYTTDTVDILETETAGGLLERLSQVGAEVLCGVLDELASGRAVAAAQDHDRATYAPMLKKSDGVVDWAKGAREVACLVRGVDPWPGAQTTWDGQVLKLFGACEAEGAGAPGEVLHVGAEGLRVACGSGACTIGALQVPGKKRMPVSAFIGGRPIAVGTILGADAG